MQQHGWVINSDGQKKPGLKEYLMLRVHLNVEKSKTTVIKCQECGYLGPREGVVTGREHEGYSSVLVILFGFGWWWLICVHTEPHTAMPFSVGMLLPYGWFLKRTAKQENPEIKAHIQYSWNQKKSIISKPSFWKRTTDVEHTMGSKLICTSL